MRKINMCLTAAWAAVFVFMAVSCGGGKDVEAVGGDVHVEDTLVTTLGFWPDFTLPSVIRSESGEKPRG